MLTCGREWHACGKPDADLQRVCGEQRYPRRDLQYTPRDMGRRKACGGGILGVSGVRFQGSGVEYNFCMQVSTRDDVITKIKASRRALKRYSVKSLALFGSAARNKMRKSSDIDVLVQFDKTTWANYIGLKFYLEDLLGREVDLVTPKALKPATKPSIEKDLLYVVS